MYNDNDDGMVSSEGEQSDEIRTEKKQVKKQVRRYDRDKNADVIGRCWDVIWCKWKAV